jgi:hypothetical protein
MSRRFLTLSLVSCLIILIAACSTQDASDDPVEPEDPVTEIDDTAEETPEPEPTPTSEPEPTPTEEPTPEPEPTETPEPTPTEIPTALESDRTDPVLLGDTATIGDWEVRVINIIPDATDEVMAANQFNDPPEEGHQFFLADVEVTYTGEEYDRFDGRFSLRAVGHEAVAYTTYYNTCGVIPDELGDPDVYTGGTISGNVCWQIRSSDAESLVMYYETWWSDSERVFLALYEGDAIPIPDPGRPPTETLPEDLGTRENPVLMNTWIDLGDGWHVRVIDSIPDATELVMDENPFNDPPEDGKQFFIAEIEATYFGSDSGRLDGTYRFRAVGQRAVTYSTFTDSCGVYPTPVIDTDVFAGGVISGNICWSIDSQDESTLVMFDDGFMTSSDRIYLDLTN